jgi:hypothetical protein
MVIGSKFEQHLRISTLTGEDTKNFAENREQLLAQAYMKFGNCYLGGSRDEDYRRHKDLSIAEKYFQIAFTECPSSSIMKFSLAQVLYMQQKERGRIGIESKEHYHDLFLDTFKNIKSQIGQITEAKILMMYYYILAICCLWGEIENEIPQMYIMRIYELRPQLPNYSSLRIFSPLSKNDLTVDEFLKEIEQFQNNIISEAVNNDSFMNVDEDIDIPVNNTERSTIFSRRSFIR